MIHNKKVYFEMFCGGIMVSFVTATIHPNLFWMLGLPTQAVLQYLGYVWGMQKEDSKC
jgi:hypothetical protein